LLKSFANGMQLDASGKIAADHTLRTGLFQAATVHISDLLGGAATVPVVWTASGEE
jgi:hypothetical protein